MIRALTSGMIGSSEPAMISVCCRIKGSAGRLPQPTAVQVCGYGPGVLRVAVAPGRDHLGEHLWTRRDHDRAGGGAHQHHATTTPGMLEGDLLREPTAPRDAEDVEPVVAEPLDEPDQEVGQHREVVRQSRHRRPADSWYVEAHDLDPRIEHGHERIQQVEAGPDAVAQHQRWPGLRARSHRDPHLMAEDREVTLAGAHHANAPTPVMSRPTMSVWIVSVPS